MTVMPEHAHLKHDSQTPPSQIAYLYAKNQNDLTTDSGDIAVQRTPQSNWLTAMSDQAHLNLFEFLSILSVYMYVKL